MTIIEIRDGCYVNLNNIFKFDLKKSESNGKVYFRFFYNDKSYSDSHEFDSIDKAKEWISLCVIRAAGADEILGL